MKVEDLSREFNSILDFSEKNPVSFTDEIVDSLWELSDRQWHTYTLVDKTIRLRIDKFIRERLDTCSIEFLNDIISIILLLGLQESYDFMIKVLAEGNIDPKIASEMESIVKEYGDDISDPFDSLR